MNVLCAGVDILYQHQYLEANNENKRKIWQDRAQPGLNYLMSYLGV